MQSDRLINTHIQIKGKHYPWGLYIGEFRHPARGYMMPTVIPNKQSGLIIQYKKEDNRIIDDNQENPPPLTHIIDDIISHFVLSVVEHQFPIINILDESRITDFPNLRRLNLDNNLNYIRKKDEFDKFNKDMDEEIIKRGDEVLDYNIYSVAQYNAQVDPRAQETYIINIVNLNQYANSTQRLYDLNEILESSEKVGIKFIFYFDKEEMDSYIQCIEDKDTRSAIKQQLSQILKKCPIIEITKDDIFFDKNSELFSQLNKFVYENRLTIELSSRKESNNILDNTLSDIYTVHKKRLEKLPQPFLKAEVGVSPNGKEVRYFELGERNQSYHAFIIGMNGTGKTTLLDHIIKGIVKDKHPKDVELYMFDYKEGVEFVKYSSLPHLRVLMLDNTQTDTILKSIIEFQSLLTERGKLFKENKVKNISEYNNIQDRENISRVYLIIDEVQKIFESNISRQITPLLIDVAKRGRAFGLTMIMSTQSITGANISDDLLGEFKMRVSFTVNARNAMKIFGIGNEEPVGLQPFNFIINDGMGIKVANQRTLLNAPDEQWINEVTDIDYGFKHDLELIDENSEMSDIVEDNEESSTTDSNIILENEEDSKEKKYQHIYNQSDYLSFEERLEKKRLERMANNTNVINQNKSGE